MTEKLYDKDSFIKDFSATVLDCREEDGVYAIVLDKTAFFPEGGGQPADKGFINNEPVDDVQIKGNTIYHYTKNPINIGANINCSINWDRRFDFMQQHSGEHIVSGVAHSLYGCENVGFHLSEDIVTLDFDKPLTQEEIFAIEQIANEKVWENLEFKAYYPDREVLKNLNYRSKKEILEDIRIVEIENTDACACCAPHVKKSGEIGFIKLLDREKLRGGVRIELKCGNRALRDYNEKYNNVKQISSSLCVKQEEVAEAVEKQRLNSENLRARISNLNKQVMELKVSAFNPENEISLLFEEELSAKDLQIFADLLYKKAGGIRAVLSGKDSSYSFAICGEADKLDIFFAKMKATLKIKGGGRNGMVQGTVTASKEEIRKFFEKIL